MSANLEIEEYKDQLDKTSESDKVTQMQHGELLDESHEKKKFIESDAGDGTLREEQYLHGVQLISCMVSLFLFFFLYGLDQTIVATIIANIGKQFNATSKIGWVYSGFFIPIAVLSVTWGRLSIIFGRKLTLIIAVILFEIGSLISGLSNSMNVMIGGRVLSGIGGGGIQSLTYVIISEIVKIDRRPLAYMIIGSTFAVSSTIGPLIGGGFTENSTWRWCFYLNLPIGGISLIFFYFSFNPPKTKFNFKEKLTLIDYVGTFLLAVSIIIFLIGFTFVSDGTYPWNSAAVISCLVIGPVFCILFIIWNFKYSTNPIFTWEIVSNPQVQACAISAFLVFLYFMPITMYASLYFQLIRGQSPISTGVSLLSFIIPSVIATFAAGILINYTKLVKPYMIFGGILGVVGCGLLTLLKVHSNLANRIGLLILPGASIGLSFQTLIISTQLSAPKSPLGTILATVYIVFGRSLGGAVGSIVSDLIYNECFTKNYNSQILTLTNDTILNDLKGVTAVEISQSIDILSNASPETLEFVKQTMMSGIRDTYWFALAASALSLVFYCFTTNKKVPQANEVATRDLTQKDEEINIEHKPREDSNNESREEDTLSNEIN